MRTKVKWQPTISLLVTAGLTRNQRTGRRATVKDDDENDFPLFLEIADRELASKNLQRRPDLLRAVLAVFDDPDPNKRFPEWARCYIGKPGRDVRVSDINDLKWNFGIADRKALVRLLRAKMIIGPKD